MITKQEVLQGAKPILFNTEMVQAILDGRKTVTRRVVKHKYSNADFKMFTNKYGTRLVEMQNDIPKDISIVDDNGVKHTRRHFKSSAECISKYKVGDILYVRETYADHWLPDGFCKDRYVYKADGVPQIGYYGNDKQSKIDVWIPSIHMPKEAARIFLKVTDVRVERLQDITWQQAAEEGCQGSTSDTEDELFHIPTLKGEFHKLWDSTIKKQDLDTYGWEANPWVWAYEFEVIDYNE